MTLKDIFAENPELKALNPHLLAESEPKRKPPKYLSNKCEYRGRIYASEFEAQGAMELDLQVAAGEIIGWMPQFVVPLRDGVKMVVDFLVVQKDGRVRLEECKSERTKTPLYRHKRKEFKALYPNIEFREIVKPKWGEK